MNPLWSNIALSLKCGWKTINSRGLWGILIMKKYLKDKYVEYWLSGYKLTANSSFFWLSFMRQFNWIKKWLTWRVGNGHKIVVGIDPIIGEPQIHSFTNDLISHLYFNGYIFLNDFRKHNTLEACNAYWLSAMDLGLKDTDTIVEYFYTSS